MSLFYTGKGDKGKSELGKPLGSAQGRRKKVGKRRPEVAVLANLDELNSLLGLVKNQRLPKGFPNILDRVQEDLFIVQANVGALLTGREHKPPLLRAEKIKWAEKLIDDFEKEVKPARGFVIPGADPSSAWLHFARAVARRTEISIVPMRENLAPEIYSYMNRLSSLLYAMARAAVVLAGLKEKNPKYR